jgi:hypothetical protein
MDRKQERAVCIRRLRSRSQSSSMPNGRQRPHHEFKRFCMPPPTCRCVHYIFLTQDSQATQRRSEELHHHPFTTENGVLYTRFEEPDILIPT